MRENILERTDELSHHLRCSMRELAGKIGISQAMLFAYRSGKSEPTLKFLRKLEAAEAAAGLESEKGPSPPRGGLEKGCDAESAGNPNEPEKGSGELLDVLARIADSLEKIADRLGKG